MSGSDDRRFRTLPIHGSLSIPVATYSRRCANSTACWRCQPWSTLELSPIATMWTWGKPTSTGVWRPRTSSRRPANPRPDILPTRIANVSPKAPSSLSSSRLRASCLGPLLRLRPRPRSLTRTRFLLWDGNSISMGSGWQAVTAARMVERGIGVDALVRRLTAIRAAMVGYATLDTLTYAAAQRPDQQLAGGDRESAAGEGDPGHCGRAGRQLGTDAGGRARWMRCWRASASSLVTNR